MGKDLKGKNIGKGYCQRKDKRYVYRFTLNSERKTIYGTNLRELKALVKSLGLNEIKIPQSIVNLIPQNSSLPTVIQNTTIQRTVNEPIQPSNKNKKTLQMLYDDFHEYKTVIEKIKETTSNSYSNSFKLYSAIQDVPIEDITFNMINKILLDEAKRSKAITYNSRVTFSKVFFKYGYNQGYENLKFYSKIKKAKVQKKERVLLSEEEYLTFIKYCNDNPKYHAIKNATILSYNTGLRAGEVQGILLNDIDFENKILKIDKQLAFTNRTVDEKKTTCSKFVWQSPKTESSNRTIPLNDDAINALKEEIECGKKEGLEVDEYEGLIFKIRRVRNSKIGTPLSCTRLFKTVRDLLLKDENYEFDNSEATFHSLRHSFTSNCIEKGISPPTVQKLLGHSSLLMTDHYTHLSEQKAINEFRSFS